MVSVLANVQGTMFMKTLIDQYIMPMLQSETPDFHPLAMAILRVACLLCNRGGVHIYVQPSDDLCEPGNPDAIFEMRCLSAWKHFLIKYFDTHAHGDIMSIYTNDIDTLRQMISQSIPQLISSVITIVSVLVSMIILNVPLTIVTLVMVGVMLVVK